MTTTNTKLNQIAKEIGTTNFEMVSSSGFTADNGQTRHRYTIRKIRGGKLFHLIGYENGVIKAV